MWYILKRVSNLVYMPKNVSKLYINSCIHVVVLNVDSYPIAVVNFS